MDNFTLTQVLVPVARRLAEIKATQEVILKAQAQFLAGVTHQPWEPMFEDLRAQAREAATQYQAQLVAELAAELRQERPERKN